QATGDLVGVVIKLAAGVQFRHDDFSRAATVFVVFVNIGRNAPPVVADGNAVVGVDGHDDIVAMAGQGFIDGVIDHFENHVMQAGSVGGIANVHAGALAYGLEPLEHFDGIRTVSGCCDIHGLI